MEHLGKQQLRIAETEKYAHVTFFFSGGREQEYAGEDRILIPSPDVATYDLKPEMSAPEVTEKLEEAIRSGKYDLIICNYANGDMVGHTGIFDAAVSAAECVDSCIHKVVDALKEVGGQCLITADHGNAEQMVDEQGHPHTQHTTGPVPLVYFGPNQLNLQPNGSLCDIAPTLLDLMQLEKPEEMTGHSLLERA
jgi:2,3-bisphosphoglycerate-independent phosphoglycerate mutase